MFIDTHTHLFATEFDEDRNEVVQRAIEAGVLKMVLPNIDELSVMAMNELVAQYPQNCYPMMGLHPCSIRKDVENQLLNFKACLEQKNIVAIGEIGIDLYWDKSTLPEQQIAFREQIRWAKALKLPIAIHARESFSEIFDVLDEENDTTLTGVFHCFTGGAEEVKKIRSYGGFKLGIGGVLTYKNANLSEVLLSVNLDEIILETDSPYLAPVPHRGKRNESSYLVCIAEKLVNIFGVSYSEIARITTENAFQLFPKITV